MRKPVSALAVHGVLALYTALALFPIILVIMNSFKARRAIFNAPLQPPGPATFSLVGYDRVFSDSAVGSYYLNSITVTTGTIFFTLLFGAMAAWALTEYKFRWNALLALYLSIGIMVPIRLGSVSIIQLVADQSHQHPHRADPRLCGAKPAPRHLHSLGVHRPDPAGLARGSALRRPVGVSHFLPHRPATDPAGNGDGSGVHHDPGME
jgi:hypothetical protein